MTLRSTATPLFRSLGSLSGFALILGLCGAGAHAAPTTYNGTFAQDDQVELIALSLNGGVLNVISLGYAGGTAVGGQHVNAGGFDSMLFLFDSAGVLVAQSDDGVNSPTDPLTGLASDAAFSVYAKAGNYTLALTQYDNFPLGNLAAGFSEAGQGNFTPGLSGTCSATKFCDWMGNSRTGNWALNVQVIPEPSGIALVLAGLTALTALRGRKTATA